MSLNLKATLRFYGNLSQAAIAGQLGISQMHVSRLISQALLKLRHQLAADPSDRPHKPTHTLLLGGLTQGHESTLSVISPPSAQEASMIPNVIRRSFMVSVAVPLAVAGVRRLSGVVETRPGPNRGTRLLRRGADTLQGFLEPRQKRGRLTRGR
jgi:hypothetical protein